MQIFSIEEGNDIISFTFKSIQESPQAAIEAIKNAVTEWGNDHESGEEAMNEVAGCFNWGDFHLHHEIETLKNKLKIFGIRKMKSIVIERKNIVDHNEVLFQS